MNKFTIALKHQNKEKPNGCTHKVMRSLVETYEVVPASDVTALLIEALDLPFEMVDGKRVVVEPSNDKLRKSLGEYVQDEKFFKSELKRQKKSYDVFKKLMDYVKSPSVKFQEHVLSKNEKVQIEYCG